MYAVCKEFLGLEKVIAVEVDHCPQSYGCLLLGANGDKIVYSGDTLPCQNLINYA
jgi:ribonuclease BN (tRNA processing enzyme)